MIYFVCLTVVANIAKAQDKEIHNYVEKIPYAAYDVNSYLANKIKYPSSVKDVQSKIIVQFIVSDSGLIDSVKILNSKGNYALDSIIVNTIQAMPHWEPARLHGKPVSARYILPIILEPR